MSQVSERVERELNEWKEKYFIPHHEEFKVKTLLKLQEEYDGVEVGCHTTKTRESLLNMIKGLHGGFSNNMLKPMKQYDYHLLVVDNDTRKISTLFKMLIPEECIRFIKEKNDYYKFPMDIHLFNGVHIYIRQKMSNHECILDLINERPIQTFDHYINLTGDYSFEEKVLKPLLNK